MPTKISSWISAFRLRTLPLALSSILMGAFLAGSVGMFSWPILLLSMLTTVCLQVLSNLANDYGDFRHGADGDQRRGPQRTVQSGQISPQEMKRGIIIAAILSFAFGVALLITSFGELWLQLLLFLFLGIGAIAAAIKYTAGTNPYGYRGLGDIFVLVFFGWVGVFGTYYLFAQTLDWAVLFPATSCGLLATGVLNLNNIRDIDSDKLAGKYSIPVRIGRRNATLYHFTLLLMSVLLSSLYVWMNYTSPWQWLFLLTVPLLVINGRAVKYNVNPQTLDPYLKQLALSTLLFVLLFGIGELLK